MNYKSVNLGSENSVKSYGTDSGKELNTTDVLACLTSILGKTVVTNTMPTINWLTYQEPKLTKNYDPALERKDIFFSRGYTGWE